MLERGIICHDLPVYIADYVLAGYGTGAIMAVPAHDERDYAFAAKYGVPITTVVAKHPITHAGGLLELKDKPGTFLFQKRDQDAPTMPGKVGLFGGKIEAGETPLEGVRRELQEELELEFSDTQIHALHQFDSLGIEAHLCAFHIKDVDQTNLVQHEGEAMLEMTLEEAVDHPDVTDSLRALLEAITGERPMHTGGGTLVNSGDFNGMDSEEAKVAITEKVGGRMTNTYRLRDWSVGRQRYWGVPIPIVYDPDGKAHPIPAEHLPWTLPTDVDFKPTGEPPLAKSKELKERTEKIFGAGWTPEVETMDTFLDSSWYFLRYLDNQNDDELLSAEKEAAWSPVDLYFGGAEHTTLHLLYSRFWIKALYDLGVIKHQEPYTRRINRGLILGPDGNKMSKSKGNVIDPDEQVKLVGSDAVKMYLAFMGPYEGSNYPWDMGGIAGVRRFLERVYGLSEHITDSEPETVTKQLHKTIKKVHDDIPQHKFNTCISALMIFVNGAEKEGLTQDSYKTFLQVIAPFAPHLSEELWAETGKSGSIHESAFPAFDEALAVDDEVTIGVQINGKVRGEITVGVDASEASVLEAVQGVASLQAHLEKGAISKVIYKPGKILNLIIK